MNASSPDSQTKVPLYMWFLLLLYLPLYTSTALHDFHTRMVCNPCDISAYKKAYTHNIHDKEFFDFANEQYTTYIVEKKAYAQTPRIPKIIHQIWIGPHKPPKKFKEWQQTWLTLHPDWEYKLWTDTEVENLYMVNKKYYDQEKNYGAKADILRLEILNQFGGLYVDVDFECLKPFDMIHHLCDFYIGFFQVNFLNNQPRIATGIIGSQPGSPLIQKLVEEIKNYRNISTIKLSNILDRTGPNFVTNVIKEHIYTSESINIVFPANYFYSWTGTRSELKLSVQPETMAIHYYTGTWHTQNTWHKKSTQQSSNKKSKNCIERQKERKSKITKASHAQKTWLLAHEK